MWVTVAVSSAASSSCLADTVTVCAVLQVDALKVRLAGSAVTSVSAGTLTVTVTLSVGWVSSLTV